MYRKQERTLTNEKLGRQCADQFQIVGKSISIARYLVESGKGEFSDNIAAEVLYKMAEEGPEALEKEVREQCSQSE